MSGPEFQDWELKKFKERKGHNALVKVMSSLGSREKIVTELRSEIGKKVFERVNAVLAEPIHDIIYGKITEIDDFYRLQGQIKAILEVEAGLINDMNAYYDTINMVKETVKRK